MSLLSNIYLLNRLEQISSRLALLEPAMRDFPASPNTAAGASLDIAWNILRGNSTDPNVDFLKIVANSQSGRLLEAMSTHTDRATYSDLSSMFLEAFIAIWYEVLEAADMDMHFEDIGVPHALSVVTPTSAEITETDLSGLLSDLTTPDVQSEIAGRGI